MTGKGLTSVCVHPSNTPFLKKLRITVFFVVISLINPLTDFLAGKSVREIKVRYVNAYDIAMAEKVSH